MKKKMHLLKTLGMAACVAAGVLGGIMINLVGARRRQFVLASGTGTGTGTGAGNHSTGRSRQDLSRTQADQPFRELRRALLGKHRKQIARVLGTPTTASMTFAAAAPMSGGKAATYWDATTWYYPFDQKQKKAIAIRFVRDRAREVAFIGSPG
jgi:hypothetical protein